MTTDNELLAAYVADASAGAFRQLVARHVDLVYASARRQVVDPGLAEDVTQTVFIMLARKAPALRPDVALPGWLMTATWYSANNAMRNERRRRRHESKAAAMKCESTGRGAGGGAGGAGDDDDAVRPLIDRALALLSETDRAAVAMHFLQGASVAEVAAALHVTPEAARKRIERAVLKLRDRLRRLGAELSPAGLAGVLRDAATVRAPETLASTAAASVADAAPEALAVAGRALAAMRWVRFKAAALPAIVLAFCAAAAGVTLMARPRADARPGGSVITAATSPAAAPSSSLPSSSAHPRAVLAAFAEAVRTGDGERALTFALVTDPPRQQPLLDLASESIRLVAQLKSAFRETAGDAEAAELPWIFGPQSVPPDAPTTVEGDRATVVVMQRKVPLVRVGQTWKVPAADTAQWVVPITDARRAGEVLSLEEAAELARQNNVAYASVLASALAGEFATSGELMAALRLRQSAAYEAMRRRFPATRPPAS